MFSGLPASRPLLLGYLANLHARGCHSAAIAVVSEQPLTSQPDECSDPSSRPFGMLFW
eukprot:m.1157001 g.1157001  ORF g.1157001 m.1157001 type:complete len:58 (+) comp24494_c0_seq36:320-493(+)